MSEDATYDFFACGGGGFGGAGKEEEVYFRVVQDGGGEGRGGQGDVYGVEESRELGTQLARHVCGETHDPPASAVFELQAALDLTGLGGCALVVLAPLHTSLDAGAVGAVEGLIVGGALGVGEGAEGACTEGGEGEGEV